MPNKNSLPGARRETEDALGVVGLAVAGAVEEHALVGDLSGVVDLHHRAEAAERARADDGPVPRDLGQRRGGEECHADLVGASEAPSGDQGGPTIAVLKTATPVVVHAEELAPSSDLRSVGQSLALRDDRPSGLPEKSRMTSCIGWQPVNWPGAKAIRCHVTVPSAKVLPTVGGQAGSTAALVPATVACEFMPRGAFD